MSWRSAESALSLEARLMLLGGVVALVVIALGGWALRSGVHDAVLSSVERELSHRAERVAANLSIGPDGRLQAQETRRPDEFHAIFSGYYWQAQQGSGGWLRSRSLWDSRLDPGQAHALAGGRLLCVAGPRGEPLLGVRRHLQLGAAHVVVYVFGPARATNLELGRLDTVLWAVQIALALLLCLGALAQVHWGLRPLRRLRRALEAVREGEQERVGRGFGPDLDPLAAEMDKVLERNARVVDRARHHAADLSHALKKPLALLGMEARQPQVAGTTVQGLVTALSRLVDRHLARAGSGAGDRRRIDVAPRLTAMLALMRRVHGERGLLWEVGPLPAACTWTGVPDDLDEMLGNLLDNAGKWARSRVDVQATVDAEELHLCVQDDGPGVPPERRLDAMRRGMRFDESIEGSGLGLAIVRDLAQTYDGRLALGVGAWGGLSACLHLPR